MSFPDTTQNIPQVDYWKPVSGLIFESSQNILAKAQQGCDQNSTFGYSVIVLTDVLAKGITLCLIPISLIEATIRTALYLLFIVLPDSLSDSSCDSGSLVGHGSYALHQTFTIMHQISFITTCPKRTSATASTIISLLHSVLSFGAPRALSSHDLRGYDPGTFMLLLLLGEAARKADTLERSFETDRLSESLDRIGETMAHLLQTYASALICMGNICTCFFPSIRTPSRMPEFQAIQIDPNIDLFARRAPGQEGVHPGAVPQYLEAFFESFMQESREPANNDPVVVYMKANIEKAHEFLNTDPRPNHFPDNVEDLASEAETAFPDGIILTAKLTVLFDLQNGRDVDRRKYNYPTTDRNKALDCYQKLTAEEKKTVEQLLMKMEVQKTESANAACKEIEKLAGTLHQGNARFHKAYKLVTQPGA